MSRLVLSRCLFRGLTACSLAVVLFTACSGGAVLAGDRPGAGSRAASEGCRAEHECASGLHWDDGSCSCVPDPLRP